MKRISLLLFAFLIPTLATEEGVSAIKTASGVMVVWDTPDIRFTVEIPGKTIKPLEHPQHFFIKVDGVPIQVQTVSIPDIYSKQVEVSLKGLMLAHRDWEKSHLEKSLGAKLQLESGLVTLTDGSEGLVWSYAMPKGMDAEVARQIYLTRPVADRLLVLNAAVIQGAKEEVIRKTLLAAANSYQAQDGPVDLKRVSEVEEKTAPEIGKDGETPQEFVFVLNKRGGGIRIAGTGKACRMVLFDDFGEGVQDNWETELTKKPDGSWVTDRGIILRVEALPTPVVVDGRTCGWKLKMSGKDPAYFEIRRALPVAEFGDPEKTEYFGNPASAAPASVAGKDEAVRTPPKGSPERDAIMNVMRFDFYKDKQKARENPEKILFVVHHLKVKDGWACANVTPTRNGKEVAEPRWAVLKESKDGWGEIDYFEKLRPFAREADTLDALDMSRRTIQRLLPKLPGCPLEIFPDRK